MANLKAEFDSYRSAVSFTATMHSPPTPAVTKLPLELSVSENMICYNSGMCWFFSRLPWNVSMRKVVLI